jgi:hypothetical protein
MRRRIYFDRFDSLKSYYYDNIIILAAPDYSTVKKIIPLIPITIDNILTL